MNTNYLIALQIYEWEHDITTAIFYIALKVSITPTRGYATEIRQKKRTPLSKSSSTITVFHTHRLMNPNRKKRTPARIPVGRVKKNTPDVTLVTCLCHTCDSVLAHL